MEHGFPCISDGGEASEPVWRDVVASTPGVVKCMAVTFICLVTPSRTSALMILKILVPMPFHGDWSGVATRKVAPLLAEGLVNGQ